MTSLPLPVHPWPLTDARLEALKTAKASIDTPFTVIPVEAGPGLQTRVLAWSTPPFLCSYAPIRPENETNVSSIAAALRLILGEAEGWAKDERWGEVDLLSAWFQGPVKFVGTEPYAPKVGFR